MHSEGVLTELKPEKQGSRLSPTFQSTLTPGLQVEHLWSCFGGSFQLGHWSLAQREFIGWPLIEKVVSKVRGGRILGHGLSRGPGRLNGGRGLICVQSFNLLAR